MAKEKFDRSLPHVNIGTIGHVEPRQDHSEPLQSPRFWLSRAMLSIRHTTQSTRLRRRRSAALPSTPHTLSITPLSVTTLTLTARAMPTTLRT